MYDNMHLRRDPPNLQPALPGVLRSFTYLSSPNEKAPKINAGGDKETAGESWPGKDFGVRKPYPGETQLSWAEAHYAKSHGLLI